MTSLSSTEAEQIETAYDEFLTLLHTKIDEQEKLETELSWNQINEYIVRKYFRLHTLSLNKQSMIDQVVDQKLNFLRSSNYKINLKKLIPKPIVKILNRTILTISESQTPGEKLEILTRVYDSVFESLEISKSETFQNK